MTLPFEQATFAAMDRRLNPASTAPVAVALSGGGDSLALLHLTVDWARANVRRVLALTVDHGLNPDSALWTKAAGAKASALDADWRELAWVGPKPGTGVQAKARSRRHALLAEAAREAGAHVILMGHTADDIAEGEIMRADTPGLGRLREWAPSPVWPEGRGAFVLRPLLGTGRAVLRTYLTGQGASWLDDPANENEQFARVRARQTLDPAHPHDPQGSVSQHEEPAFESLVQTAQDWEDAYAMRSGTSDALARSVSFAPACAHAPARPFLDADPLAARWVLTALLMSVGGTVTPPRGDELDHVIQVIRMAAACTLAGCRMEVRSSIIAFTREPARQGQLPRSEEPSTWTAYRFYAACGLYTDEASIPPVA